MLDLLRNKKLYVHLGLMFLIFVALFWVSLKIISSVTRHGESVKVPNLIGLHPDEIEDMDGMSDFNFLVVDSVYDSEKEKGSICNQIPLADAKVKSGRIIYLTVVSMHPEQLLMPNLLDLTLRNATSLIETYGLKVGNVSYVPDIAKDAVVRVQYNGRIIQADEHILKGSTIDLVLGLGQGVSGNVTVPLLIGKKRSEAIALLRAKSLNVGNEYFDAGDDSSKVRVYRQNPFYSSSQNVQSGSSVDLWYKSDKNFDFEQYLEVLKRDSNLQIDQ